MVHVGDVLVRGLLHNPSVLRVHLPGSDVDRASISPSPETNDCS